MASVLFDIQALTYIVSSGEPFEMLSGMFVMFDSQLWHAIAGTLLIALVTIRMVSFMSSAVQDLVFGQGVRRPTLSLLEIFLCGTQYRVTNGSFARFLVMMFIIWSLIIRTCYQSTLFEYLQAEYHRRREGRASDLTMDHLELCFLACIISISLSMLVFAVELVVEHFQKELRSLIKKIVLRFTVKAYMNLRSRIV